MVGFYHTTEHLSEAAELLFGKILAKAQSWYETYHHKLLTQDGAAETLIRSIDYYKNQRRLVKTIGRPGNGTNPLPSEQTPDGLC